MLWLIVAKLVRIALLAAGISCLAIWICGSSLEELDKSNSGFQVFGVMGTLLSFGLLALLEVGLVLPRKRNFSVTERWKHE